MLFHDNPKDKLVWLEDELLDDELEEILYGGEGEYPEDDWDEDSDAEDDGEEEGEAYEKPRKKQKKKKRRPIPVDEDDEDRYMLLPRKKGIKGLVFLACLEVLAILVILGWWLQWLI